MTTSPATSQPAHPLRAHHWGPIPQVVEWVVRQVPAGGRVLEIGPGHVPFPLASVFVDWNHTPAMQGRDLHVLDINQDRLPFEDGSFDFVYCRHVLEDIYNPLWVCREMQRVAKAGYIECPSPIAECARGVDGNFPPWRGYHHHRYAVWNDNGVLTFLPKYPAWEMMPIPPAGEQQLYDILNTSPWHWNTYLLWRETLPARMLHHGREFDMMTSYPEICSTGINHTLDHHRQFHAQVRGE